MYNIASIFFLLHVLYLYMCYIDLCNIVPWVGFRLRRDVPDSRDILMRFDTARGERANCIIILN